MGWAVKSIEISVSFWNERIVCGLLESDFWKLYSYYRKMIPLMLWFLKTFFKKRKKKSWGVICGWVRFVYENNGSICYVINNSTYQDVVLWQCLTSYRKILWTRTFHLSFEEQSSHFGWLSLNFLGHLRTQAKPQ